MDLLRLTTTSGASSLLSFLMLSSGPEPVTVAGRARRPPIPGVLSSLPWLPDPVFVPRGDGAAKDIYEVGIVLVGEGSAHSWEIYG